MLFGLFGKKVEKRPVWHWGEDRVIKRKMLEVESGVVLDNKVCRAHHMIHDFMMRDAIEGGLALVAWQRDAFPKHPFRKLDTVRKSQLEDINKIAAECGRTVKDRAIEEQKQYQFQSMLTMLGFIFGIIILISIIYMIWQGGGLENLF